MRLSFKFTFLLALTHLALGATQINKRWNDFSEKHSWAEIPNGWEHEGPAHPDHTFDLRISLKQHRIDGLIANLLETSDPYNPRYGQHLTPSEAEALVAAHPDAHASVSAWLSYHTIPESSIRRFSVGGDWLALRVSVSQAERLLNTTYAVYVHSTTGERVIRSMSYSLPRELHAHIDLVTPTTYFGTTRTMRATHFLEPEKKSDVNAAPSDCNTAITPSCLRSLYNTNDYKVVGKGNNSVGVVGFLNEYANYADFQAFIRQFRPDAAGANFSTLLVNGGQNLQSKPGVEANLDIQYTYGMTFPIPHTYYSTGGSPPFMADDNTPTNTNEPYLDFLEYILKQSKIPPVLSISYGDDEQTVPPDYAQKVCDLFAQLGSLGASVFFSSGDSGVGGGSCKSNDGTNKVVFQPTFPASCPFVTAVGGTTKISPEVAAGLSGGGFSAYFGQPSYQRATVSTFLSKLGSTNAGMFNRTGRAYPDISAQAISYQVVVGGKVQRVSGTSASAPTVASVFALLNDVRQANNKPTFGFLNPFLYANPSAFNDITSGSNPGCKTNGFTAGAGWDPVTGLGTPDFVKLKAVV